MCWRVVCCIRFSVFQWRRILCLGNTLGKEEISRNNFKYEFHELARTILTYKSCKFFEMDIFCELSSFKILKINVIP